MLVNLQIIPFVAVPTAAPQNVKLKTPSSESIQVSWQPPPVDTHNGVLLGYKVAYTTDDSSKRTNTTGKQITLRNLKKYTLYSVTVQAYTIIGDGPASDKKTIRTLEDGKSGRKTVDTRNSYQK